MLSTFKKSFNNVLRRLCFKITFFYIQNSNIFNKILYSNLLLFLIIVNQRLLYIYFLYKLCIKYFKSKCKFINNIFYFYSFRLTLHFATIFSCIIEIIKKKYIIYITHLVSSVNLIVVFIFYIYTV